jgi:alpha-amylase
MRRKCSAGRWLSLLLLVLWLAGCGAAEKTSPTSPTPTAAPPTATSMPPTAAQTAIPPTETVVPTATSVLLGPGDEIGEMAVDKSPSQNPILWDYCPMAWSDRPGGEPVVCTMPWQPEVEIWGAWGAKDQALLDAGWEALAWETYVDGQALDLEAFGTWDFDWAAEDGTPVRIRAWDLKLVNPTPGKHTLHYILRTTREVNNGLALLPPSTTEIVLHVIVAPPEAALLTPTPVWTPPPVQQSWWNGAVFYEVFVRSFADSTTGPLANDGIGDLQGLIEKLDYLNDGDPATDGDLGVTGLWLMPIMQSPSYHGYDVTDYYTVNSEYGTNEDFERLVAEAHKRGIKIIIDLVLNHTSSEHPWFVEARDMPGSERRDWYLWSEEKPNDLGPWGQEVWHDSPTGYYYGLFWEEMPDLNLENPQVTAEMHKVARFWLEDLGVDGFRLDAARHLIEEGSIQESTQATHQWWKGFRTVVKASNPEALEVGEMWTRGANVVEYLRGDELDLAFDFDLAEALVSYVGMRTGNRIQGALASSYALYGSGLSATFLTNHDMNRVMSMLRGDAAKAKLAASVLLTAPGVPFVYYGEEIGMTGQKPDEMIRTPMQWSAGQNAGFTAGTPWEPLNGDYEEKNVARQTADPTSLLSLYRDLIHLRLAHPALQVGDYHPVASTDAGIVAYLRSSDEEKVLMIINLDEEPASGYYLSLNEGLLEGTYRASLLYGAEADLPDLVANKAGGFDSYRPLTEISGERTIIIQLQPIE